jgi:hypothetical protein
VRGVPSRRRMRPTVPLGRPRKVQWSSGGSSVGPVRVRRRGLARTEGTGALWSRGPSYTCGLPRRSAMPWFGRRTNLLPQARLGRRTSSSLPVGTCRPHNRPYTVTAHQLSAFGARAPRTIPFGPFANPRREEGSREEGRRSFGLALCQLRNAASVAFPAARCSGADGTVEQYSGPAHQSSLDVDYLSPLSRDPVSWSQALARYLRDPRCGSSVLGSATSSREPGSACRPH